MLKINNQTDEVIVFNDIIESVSASSNRDIDPSQEHKWANSSDVLSAITNGDIKIERNGVEYDTYADQVNVLKNLQNDVTIVAHKSKNLPFSAKELDGGVKLFRRKHGVSATIPANSSGTISLVIPYPQCKIDQAEIVNCAVGDTVDLKVYDTPTGTISTVPNFMLNQFGFGVTMPDNFYVDKSNYDADLIQNMKVEVTYYNNSASPRDIGVNITLHQLVS
jgi:hypothetical protein